MFVAISRRDCYHRLPGILPLIIFLCPLEYNFNHSSNDTLLKINFYHSNFCYCFTDAVRYWMTPISSVFRARKIMRLRGKERSMLKYKKRFLGPCQKKTILLFSCFNVFSMLFSSVELINNYFVVQASYFLKFSKHIC